MIVEFLPFRINLFASSCKKLDVIGYAKMYDEKNYFCMKVKDLAAEQDSWLDQELQNAKNEGCKHILVFQHIPWFLFHPEEEKEYFNMEITLRKKMLEKFHKAGKSFI